MSSNRTSSAKTAIGAVVGILIMVGAVVGVGFTLHQVSRDPEKKLYATVNGTVNTPQGTLKHAFVSLGVYGDPWNAGDHTNPAEHPSWPSYGPATHVVVPAHALVTMTITSYDGGETLNNAFFGRVIGTTDENGNVTNSAIYDGKPLSQLPANQVEHTFTLHSLPNPGVTPLFVNVPLQLNTDAELANYNKNFANKYDHSVLPKGHTVTFSFVTGSKGEYVWNCEYPCGDQTYQGFGAVMGSTGYMSGKVSVV